MPSEELPLHLFLSVLLHSLQKQSPITKANSSSSNRKQHYKYALYKVRPHQRDTADLLEFLTELTDACFTVTVPYVLAGNRSETLDGLLRAAEKAAAPAEDPSRKAVVLVTTTEPVAMLVMVTSTV